MRRLNTGIELEIRTGKGSLGHANPRNDTQRSKTLLSEHAIRFAPIHKSFFDPTRFITINEREVDYLSGANETDWSDRKLVLKTVHYFPQSWARSAHPSTIVLCVLYGICSTRVSDQSHGSKTHQELAAIPLQIRPVVMGCEQILSRVHGNVAVFAKLDAYLPPPCYRVTFRAQNVDAEQRDEFHNFVLQCSPSMFLAEYLKR